MITFLDSGHRIKASPVQDAAAVRLIFSLNQQIIMYRTLSRWSLKSSDIAQLVGDRRPQKKRCRIYNRFSLHACDFACFHCCDHSGTLPHSSVPDRAAAENVYFMLPFFSIITRVFSSLDLPSETIIKRYFMEHLRICHFIKFGRGGGTDWNYKKNCECSRLCQESWIPIVEIRYWC